MAEAGDKMAPPRRRVQLHRRKHTSVPQFALRIPQDIKSRMIGRTLAIPLSQDTTVKIDVTELTQSIRFSLRTYEHAEARRRKANASAYLDKYFAAIRSSPSVELTHRQTLALAGELYCAWASEPDSIPQSIYMVERLGLPTTPPTDFDAESERLAAMAFCVEALAATGREGERIAIFGPVTFTLLAQKGIPDAPLEAIERISLALCRALSAALRTRARYAAGDYRRDEALAGYPVWEQRKANSTESTKLYRRHSAALGKLTVTGLLNDWWAAAKANGASINTFTNFTTHINQFVAYLGHDDARAVTTENVLDFKNHKLTTPSAKTKKPISARSFKSGALVSLTSVFTWATNERLLPSNPTEGIVFRVRKQARVRQRDFTEEEIAIILKATLTVRPVAGTRFYKRDLANKWIPWLCAYSGARVGEIAQLRKRDVKEGPQGHYLNVTPEAGTVKTKEFREVPIHEHLIAMGFLDMVENAGDGYLFIDPKSPDVVHTAIATRSARVRDFVRGAGVTDPNVQPNHGWRHTFKTRGFEAGIQEKVLDAICGHAPSTVGRQYGSVTTKTLVDAMKLFPRYELEDGNNA